MQNWATRDLGTKSQGWILQGPSVWCDHSCVMLTKVSQPRTSVRMCTRRWRETLSWGHKTTSQESIQYGCCICCRTCWRNKRGRCVIVAWLSLSSLLLLLSSAACSAYVSVHAATKSESIKLNRCQTSTSTLWFVLRSRYPKSVGQLANCFNLPRCTKKNFY